MSCESGLRVGEVHLHAITVTYRSLIARDGDDDVFHSFQKLRRYWCFSAITSPLQGVVHHLARYVSTAKVLPG